ncbi:glycosyltransferase [Rubellimicrobium aerolatum]|uniref:Glycosyltransferase n=1 Tax=Rubellimicrobium aerolatum TaxID=490979 RepID=A0ABW0SEA9_9RHOB|nr:glycosyltransferase [Rubellimicrobium aerolatum]MBP1806815.1 hypothetical protein [Rubellimicrobium aerolatum]
MTTTTAKPKLVFFQWDHAGNAKASRFLVLHMQDHVDCLREHFDVVVVNQDCDFAEVCDRHEPDLVLFESGYRSHGSRRIEIANARANPGLPRLGLHNGDPWCDRRAGFLSDMDRWGVETFFSIGTRMGDYTPAIADRLFVWPNFVNPATFHDYGLPKTVPVMLTGQAGSLYPWRQAVYPQITAHFACLVTPTFRYESRSAHRMLSGEGYARALNASMVAPTCGTMGNEFVRKHLEIPGSRCCLVTQRTAALEAAGFLDGENCVFAEAGDVVDRIDDLLASPDRLRAITDAGHALVHARHTIRHRPQIRQWFDLQQSLRLGESIVQRDPFADLAVTEGRGGLAWSGGPAQDRLLVAEGRALLASGRTEVARQRFDAALALVGYLPEARLDLARCDLTQGDAAAARARLATLIATTTSEYGAADPDPVELAWFLVALLASGDVPQAGRTLLRYPALSHPWLDHLVRAIGRLDPTFRASAPVPHRRPSLHEAPTMSPDEALAWLAGMLTACGQPDLARRLSAPANAAAKAPARASSPVRAAGALRDGLYAAMDDALPRLGLGHLKPGVPPLPEFGYGRLLAKQVLRAVLPTRARERLSRLRAWVRDRGDATPNLVPVRPTDKR